MPGMREQSGDKVADWQKALSEAGYNPGPVDGKWGPKTSAATKKFQADFGTDPDGIVKKQEWEEMSKFLAGKGKTNPKGGSFFGKPLFWIAGTAAALVLFSSWRDKS